MNTRFSISFPLLIGLAMLCARESVAQGAVSSGEIATGAISAAGETDSWTTVASQGDRLVVQVAEVSGGAGFSPRIEVLAPDGTVLGASTGGTAARLDLQAHVNGTFTIAISDQNRTGTGTYRLQLARVPAAFTVPAGDEGGPLTNGVNHPGVIDVGDLDLWTFTANALDRISLQIGETAGAAAFTPQIELFGPNGGRLGASSGGVAARIDAQASLGGTYTVLVSDLNQSGSGSYRLRLAQVPGAFVVPAGDDGGALTNGQSHAGTIDVGDLDLWTFAANEGDRIVLQLGEASGGAGFTPMVELFAPNGARLGIDSDGTVARLDAQAAVAGTYTVLVSDANQSGTGTYQLRLAKVPGPFDVPAGGEGGALADATDQDGTITAGDLDLWTFPAVPGDRVTVLITELTGGASFTPMIELFTPGGQRRANSQGGSTATLDVAIEVGGTYTILVSDANQTGAGTYRLRLTRGTIAPAGANVLSSGTMHLGTISPAGDSDTWTFTATIGDRIVLRVGEMTQTGNFGPRIRLINPLGGQQAINSGSTAAGIEVPATNTGTFSVIVDDLVGTTATGTYRLTLAKVPSAVSVSAGDEGGPLTNGLMHTGNIDVGDIDVWTFTANAGESITVRMGETVNSSSLTPALWLYGPNGLLLDSFGASSAASEVYFRATNSGTFTVVAGDFSSAYAGSGAYRLTLAKSGDPVVVSAGDEGGPLTNGATYTGNIDVGDVDVWSFVANAGESITLRMGETQTASPLTPALWLYSPNGVLLDSFGASGAASEVYFRATNSGTFTVVAGDFSGGYVGSGTYRLTLAKTGDPIAVSTGDEGGLLTNGMMHTGNIDVGEVDVWGFVANAGESITIRAGELISGSALTPGLWLYSPNGVLLDSFGASAAASEVYFRATNSGTFTVVVADFSGAYIGSGTYRLTLAKTGAPIVTSSGDEGGPLINGVMHTGTIDVGDVDVWSFTANAGESIVVRMGEAVSGSPLTPGLWLYGPNGLLLDSFGASASASEVSFRATNSGTFIVVATDYSGAYVGSGIYRLSLAKTGTALTTSPGDEGGQMTGAGTYDGVIDVGDVDAWTFTACAGDSLVIRMEELVAGSALTPWLRLYGRDGTPLDTISGTSSAQIARNVPAHGTYLLVASDFSGAYVGSGNYRLTVNGLSDGLKLCRPVVNGTNVSLVGIGGTPGATFSLLTSTNVATPLVLWTPIRTNQFDQFGLFNLTNAFSRFELERYFTIRTP